MAITGVILDALQSKEFVAGVGGAVIGAIVGGSISFLLQNQNIKTSKRDRDAERFVTKQGLANSILFKVMYIHSDIGMTVRYIGSTLERRGKDRNPERLWAYLLPRGNLSRTMEFTPDEIGMLIGLGDAESTNDLMKLELLHADMLHIWKLYEQKREDLSKILPVSSAEGAVISSEMSDPKFFSAAPAIIAVNSIATYIFNSTLPNYTDSGACLERIYSVLKEKLKLPFQIKFDLPEDLISALAVYEAEHKAANSSKETA